MPVGRQSLGRVAAVLRRGGVAAYPTEGVWGLGCDPLNRAAVERILQLKGRNARKGLILIAADLAQLEPYLEGLSPRQYTQLAESWPDALTWLVPNNGYAPAWLTGDHSSLAVRIPAHPLARALAAAFGGPIVSTSANPQGRPAATTQLAARLYFGTRVDAYLTGQVLHPNQPSEIRELATGRVIRPRHNDAPPAYEGD